jgi:hypothetical protein
VNKRREQIKFLIFVLIFVLGVVGCSVLLRSGEGSPGGAGGEGQPTAETPSDLTTMTFQEFDSITNNATRADIEEKYGTPVPRQVVIDQGIIPDDASTEGCIYYKADPPTFGEWFEFCFEGEQLANKTSL